MVSHANFLRKSSWYTVVIPRVRVRVRALSLYLYLYLRLYLYSVSDSEYLLLQIYR